MDIKLINALAILAVQEVPDKLRDLVTIPIIEGVVCPNHFAEESIRRLAPDALVSMSISWKGALTDQDAIFRIGNGREIETKPALEINEAREHIIHAVADRISLIRALAVEET